MNVIRSYITKQIQSLHPKLKHWDNDYSFQEAPANKLDELFLLTIGDFTPTQENNHILNVVPVEVKIPKQKKTRGEQVSKESCLEIGSKLMACIAHPKNYKYFVIAAIRPEKLVVDNMANNPDVFEITINFSFEIYQSL